ncbi:MAG: hypothetical protein RXR01_07065 [Thermoproteus sp.]
MKPIPVRLGITLPVFSMFLHNAVQKAFEDKEAVACGEVKIDARKEVYVVTALKDVEVLEESLGGVSYMCKTKDVVIHTHVNMSAYPSGIDAANMKKDNMPVKLGKIIRPPNPVFYIIGTLERRGNGVGLWLEGYYPNFQLREVSVEPIETKEVVIKDFSIINKIINKINYGTVEYKDSGEVVVKRLSNRLEEGSSDGVGYYVTGLRHVLGEPQDFLLLYTVLSEREEATIFKFGTSGVSMFRTRRSSGVELEFSSPTHTEVVVYHD